MAKNIFGILLGLLLTIPVFGQLNDDTFGDTPVNSRVKAARVAYITDFLKMTPKESEQFWALHNEYESKKKEIRKSYIGNTKLNDLTEEEAKALILKRLELEEALLGHKKEYFLQFLEVLPAKKLAKFPKADRAFRQELLKRMGDNRRRRFGN